MEVAASPGDKPRKLEIDCPQRHLVRIDPMQTTSSLDTWGMAQPSSAQGPRR
jgi:hypothetical protein